MKCTIFSKKTAKFLKYFNASELFDYPENLTLSEEEVDKYLFCGALLQMKVKKDLNIIEEIANNVKDKYLDNVYDQIGTAIIEKCLENASPKTIHKHFSNGLYIEEITEDYYKYYNSYYDIDYNTILKEKSENRNQNDLDHIYKVQKAIDIHNKKQQEAKKRLEEEENYEKDNHEKIKAVGVDLLKVPYYLKVFLFVIVFGALFGGTLYYINSIINKPKKEKKEKKKKKKNQ